MSTRPALALLTLLAAACGPGQSGSASAGDAEACLLAPDPGNCDFVETRWYYDQDAQRCAPFSYSGCEGVAPFDSAPQCQSACESCDQLFDDAKPAGAPGPTITVRNTGAATVYLQAYTSGGGAVGFRRQAFAFAPAGAGEPLVSVPNACDFPCAAFDNPECSNACSDDGPPPPPIAIAPGGAYTGAWDGLHFGSFDMPARCVPAACADGLTCGRWQLAADGDYEVRIAWAQDTSCGPACTCTPNPEGWCALPEGTPADLVGLQTASGAFYFPGPSPVQIDL